MCDTQSQSSWQICWETSGVLFIKHTTVIIKTCDALICCDVQTFRNEDFMYPPSRMCKPELISGEGNLYIYHLTPAKWVLPANSGTHQTHSELLGPHSGSQVVLTPHNSHQRPPDHQQQPRLSRRHHHDNSFPPRHDPRLKIGRLQRKSSVPDKMTVSSESAVTPSNTASAIYSAQSPAAIPFLTAVAQLSLSSQLSAQLSLSLTAVRTAIPFPTAIPTAVFIPVTMLMGRALGLWAIESKPSIRLSSIPLL